MRDEAPPKTVPFLNTNTTKKGPWKPPIDWSYQVGVELSADAIRSSWSNLEKKKLLLLARVCE